MARAWAARLRTIDSSAICLACGLRSIPACVGGSTSVRKRDLHPFVVPAFAADLKHADGTDLGDVPDMSPAAWLQVDARNSEEPYASSTSWRLHAHGLDQLGSGVEVIFGDPDGLGFGATRNER